MTPDDAFGGYVVVLSPCHARHYRSYRHATAVFDRCVRRWPRRACGVLVGDSALWWHHEPH